MNGFDYMMFRGTICLIVGASEAFYKKVNVFKFPKQTYLSISLRTLTGVIGMPCYFYGLRYLPMSQATIILSINPLISAILSYFFLSEVLHMRDIICLLGAFIGIFITNTTKAENQNTENYSDKYFLGIVLCLIALCFRSTAPVTMRQM
mmetsp:Transcript_16472/g.14379  ORF Transcript_16472/g.14379 Transcript_16472/m.14379 type:complete len:149 (-) Transcript_16472:355-801(-)